MPIPALAALVPKLLGGNLLGGLFGGNNQQAQPVYLPAPVVQKDNTGLYVGIGGGAIFLVLIVVLLLRRG